MTARRSLIFILAAVLALTMCSFSVFAMDKSELVTATAPDVDLSAEAPDGAVSTEPDVETEAPDGAEADGAEADGAEATDLAEDGTEATDDADDATDTEPKKFVGSAGFWVLIVLGAIVLVFLILWIVKPSFREKVKKLIREYKSELKKIVWSSKEDVVKNTKTVVIAIVVTAVVVGLIDLGLAKLIDLVGQIGR